MEKSIDQATARALADEIPVYCSHDEIIQTEKAIPNPRNPNQHPPAQLQLLAKIIKAQGWRAPITISTRSGHIVKGHGRLQAAQLNGSAQVPVEYQEYASEAEEWADMVADNRLAELSEMDEGALADLLTEMDTGGMDMELTGYGEEEMAELINRLGAGPTDGEVAEAKRTLNERFIVPPFSILDSRQGYWRERKAAWIRLGISSEHGRSAGLLFQSPTASDPQFYQQKTATEARLGRKLETAEFIERYYTPPAKDNSTSIFDPVLCELAYKWFCPPGGSVVDPFAGGSVRGAVAALCGRKYTGVDLRAEQVEANVQQWQRLSTQAEAPAPAPAWICGDSTQIEELVQEPHDFLFTCPPYGDLEVYSDDPADISNMDYADFLEAYRLIIAAACRRLKENRFACVVVGDIRDKKGHYRNFVGDTIAAFEEAGLHYYNEGVYITQPGGLTIRVSRMFSKGRKLGKTHQNMLVFVKGDQAAAVGAAGGPLYADALLRFDGGDDIPIKTIALAEETRIAEPVHAKMLVFVKGSAKSAVEDCGDVDVYIPIEMEADALME